MRKKPTIYLASGMEHAPVFGAGWREQVTPHLERLGFEVLNPCLFEPDQLKGLHTSRLPEGYDHWHDLKKAPLGSAAYKRFVNYMRRIIRYDVNVVKNDTDILLCYWTKGTSRGAGTHTECSYAFMHGVPVYLVVAPDVERDEVPGWVQGCAERVFLNFDSCINYLEREG